MSAPEVWSCGGLPGNLVMGKNAIIWWCHLYFNYTVEHMVCRMVCWTSVQCPVRVLQLAQLTVVCLLDCCGVPARLLQLARLTARLLQLAQLTQFPCAVFCVTRSTLCMQMLHVLHTLGLAPRILLLDCGMHNFFNLIRYLNSNKTCHQKLVIHTQKL